MPGKDWWEDFNLPFEPVPDPTSTQQDSVMAGAVVCAAAVIDGGAELGKVPAIQFRFVNALGQLLPPITLVLDAAHMELVPDIVREAVHAAIKESKR